MQERNTASFNIATHTSFKQQMLGWANQFNICCFLDDNQYYQKFHSHDCLLAVGANKVFSPKADIIPQLKQFDAAHNDWLFGHINYDLKNEIEPLQSRGIDKIGFPNIFLFQPDIVVEINGAIAVISSLTQQPVDIFSAILQQAVNTLVQSHKINIQPRLNRQQYLNIIKQLQAHILRGDCYEINFCQEFFAEGADINPLQVFQQLSVISPSPFACYYRLNDKYLVCSSPERYIKRTGSTVISQPMKGTNKRDLQDAGADQALKNSLLNSEKDRSENVMVVDLVRNDFSKICVEGSVHTEELFGVYSYAQVHQMVSTIKGELQPGLGIADVLQATFPMGSMTGAPKRRVMELIEQYEPVKRGIFSGAVGYITPHKDFDFNVVIRSIMYNANTRYLNYLTGSGITFYSDAATEYEECMLKAQGMERALM